jgi:hypothetical protein
MWERPWVQQNKFPSQAASSPAGASKDYDPDLLVCTQASMMRGEERLYLGLCTVRSCGKAVQTMLSA